MKLIKVLSCCVALLVGCGFMFCHAMDGKNADSEKVFNKTFKGQSSEIIVVNIRKGRAIQVITSPKLIKKLKEKIKEMIYYDEPTYISMISAMPGDCSVIDDSHHFFINKTPTPENIRRAKIIIKNALFRMGYTTVIWDMQ
ncbi:MAG: hypothetical protein IJJ04_00055 [Clostridia bacterium]|nr:hypothetical protein [Clostridia bacterium]